MNWLSTSLLVGLLFVGLSKASCPTYWTQFGKNCYRYVNKVTNTYEDHTQFCAQFSSCCGVIAHVSTAETTAELNFFYRFLKSFDLTSAPALFQGLRLSDDGVLIGQDNEQSSVAEFRIGMEPSMPTPCVKVRKGMGNRYVWTAITCDANDAASFCEMRAC